MDEHNSEDRAAALCRIEELVNAIKRICEEFDFDPIQWLSGGDDE